MTTVRRTYRNPPVVEALVELFFEGSTWDITAPGSFYERVKDRFPKKGQREQVELEVALRPGGANARMESGGRRAVFKSEDESRWVQVGGDVLVVNQLRPYPHFEAWSPTLFKMLAIYRELAQPANISRLGLRYINRVTIPRLSFKLEHYFRAFVDIPDDLSDGHEEFLMRVQLRPPHSGHRLLFTLGTAQPEKAGSASLLLDLYDTVTLDEEGSFDLVRERLDEAHANVEHTFERAITDATRALFLEGQ